LRFTRPTKIIASEEFDVAVLLTDTELIPITIGDSDTVEVTDAVLSIGNPFGLRESVSAGIISAKNRLSLPTGNQKLPLQGFFQTDAQINPGNSGGPLLTTDGKVIGMVTAIASAGGQHEGIAFAIPINSIVKIVTQLLEQGFIVRPQIGLELDTDFDLEARINTGFRRIVGTRVKSVTPNGAAYVAGMIPGDIVTHVGKTEVLSDEHFIQLVARSAVGSKLDIEIIRKGQMLRCQPVVSSVNVQGKVTLPE
jgi:serine protease Do